MPIWMLVVEWLARGVLLLLVGLSVWSIAIIIERWKYLLDTEDEFDEAKARELVSSGDIEKIRNWSDGKSDLLAVTIQRALSCDSIEKIDRSVGAFLSEKKVEMEERMVILGTLGSTTPFIGLFGTVLGIIVAFGALSMGQIDSKQIMFALAEALVLTAAGLAVAIPAVIAFNVFNRKIRNTLNCCERLKNRFIADGFGK